VTDYVDEKSRGISKKEYEVDYTSAHAIVRSASKEVVGESGYLWRSRQRGGWWWWWCCFEGAVSKGTDQIVKRGGKVKDNLKRRGELVGWALGLAGAIGPG
jgi:hypothetical protein